MKTWIFVFLFLTLTIVRAKDSRELGLQSGQLEPARHKSRIPDSIKAEHEELHQRLAEAMKAGGETGQKASDLSKLMSPHFAKEELFALPPLSLLPQISAGKVNQDMKDIVPLTDELKAQLPEMLKEHKAIVGALNELRFAAKKEKRPEIVRFTEELKHHAETEEQILYPTAILIGDLVKMKLGQ